MVPQALNPGGAFTVQHGLIKAIYAHFASEGMEVNYPSQQTGGTRERSGASGHGCSRKQGTQSATISLYSADCPETADEGWQVERRDILST